MKNNLKKIRTEQNISLKECVRKTGIPIETLKRYEKGGTTICVEHLLTLRDFYKSSLDAFFDEYTQKSQEETER